MSESEHLAAVIAAINTADGNALSLGDLEDMKPNGLPTSYNEVIVMQRLGDGPSRGSEPSATGQWRIFTRAVANDYDNALEMRRRAAAGLLGVSLTVGGEQTTEIERTLTDDPIAPDDGWFSGASEFGYAL